MHSLSGCTLQRESFHCWWGVSKVDTTAPSFMSLSPLSQRARPQWHHSLTRQELWVICVAQVSSSLPAESRFSAQPDPHAAGIGSNQQRVRECCSTSRCQAAETLTDLQIDEKPRNLNFSRLNDIIQTQYLQSFTDDSSGCIKATSPKKQNLKMAKWLAGNMWQISRKKALPSSNLVLCPLNHTSLFNMSPL